MTPYDVLKVPPDASAEQIERAYLQMRDMLTSDEYANHPKRDEFATTVQRAYKYALAHVPQPRPQTAPEMPASAQGRPPVAAERLPDVQPSARSSETDRLPPSDLAAPTKGRQDGSGRKKLSIVVAVFAVALVGALGLAGMNALRASEWQDVARSAVEQRDTAHEELDDSLDQLEGASEELDLALADLQASESDVGRLEVRIDELADERAQADDERNLMTLEVSAWQDLASATLAVTEGLEICILDMAALQNDLVAAHNSGAADMDSFNSRGQDVYEMCDEVLELSWELQDLFLLFVP